MTSSRTPPPPTTAELKTFGLLLGGFISLMLGLVIPWLLSRPIPMWPWYVAIVFIVWALLAPASLAPIHHGFLKFGAIMGKITTPVLMTAVFVFTIVPTALVMRVIKRDALHRKLSPEADSYRVVPDPDMERSLDNPF
ncbi:MAG: SxtJ family membrane protein [Lysobacterales bacterium]